MNDISISPRLDAQAGRIKKGRIYAGGDLENMALVTDFTGDGSENPIVVSLNRTESRYVQIHSLEATSANTAVSEIKRTAFSRPEEEGPPTAQVPPFMMRAEANSYNSTCPPVNATDGDPNTLWHSEWTPENAPFPHVLTIELQKKAVPAHPDHRPPARRQRRQAYQGSG
ncbi:MAG: hypothetical protein HFE86_01340 [Clostridiales bacterium]|nr:hypothetical protein [Clostridiales bacterium]